MIRTIVLIALLATIFYCAFADAARAGEFVAARPGEAPPARFDLRARCQFLPGSMAALHGRTRDLAGVVSMPAATRSV